MRELLLWARLYVSSGGETDAALNAALLPIFERALGARAGKASLAQAVAKQVQLGNVSKERGPRSTRYLLTKKGVAFARAAFPHSNAKKWAAIAKTELIAHALGMHDGLSPKDVASLSRAGVLRLAIVGRYLSLDVPAVPSATAFEQALVWSALRRGVTNEIFQWGKGRAPKLQTIVSALAASLGHVSPSPKKDVVYALIAAKAVNATNAEDLHEALLTRLVIESGTKTRKKTSPKKTPPKKTASLHKQRQQSTKPQAQRKQPIVPSTPVVQPEATVQESNGLTMTSSPAVFAERVLEAARRSNTGKLDASLILINHAYDQFRRDYPADSASLDDFKQQLWACGLEGLLKLASADMPQVLDAKDYTLSRIDRGTSVFSLIRI